MDPPGNPEPSRPTKVPGGPDVWVSERASVFTSNVRRALAPGPFELPIGVIAERPELVDGTSTWHVKEPPATGQLDGLRAPVSPPNVRVTEVSDCEKLEPLMVTVPPGDPVVGLTEIAG